MQQEPAQPSVAVGIKIGPAHNVATWCPDTLSILILLCHFASGHSVRALSLTLYRLCISQFLIRATRLAYLNFYNITQTIGKLVAENSWRFLLRNMPSVQFSFSKAIYFSNRFCYTYSINSLNTKINARYKGNLSSCSTENRVCFH